MTIPNVDAAEVRKFDALADRWWDPTGPNRPLHELNPVRLQFVMQQAELNGAQVLDVGCGGGLLAESMARAGAAVTGIDAAHDMLRVARTHAAAAGLAIDYQSATAEDFARAHPGRFHLVTCMELLEHVPDPAALVAACARVLRPGGTLVVSTLNRTPQAYLFAVIGAEYVLRLLPRGTHDYRRFIRPSELDDACRLAGLHITALTGIRYNPVFNQAALGASIAVNYLACARAPARP